MYRLINWLPIKENKILNLNLKFDIPWIPYITENTILTILKIFIFKRCVWTISFLAYSCHELHVFVFSPIPVIIIFWIKYLSVTWYTTCGTCTVLWLFKGFLYILSMYVPPWVCKGLIWMHTLLFSWLCPDLALFQNLFPRPVYVHVQWMIQRSVDLSNIYPLISAPCILMHNSIIFYNKGRYVTY